MLCVLGWLGGCAHLPEDIRPYVSDLGAMNVAAGRLGPLRYIRSGSYLPGESRSLDSDQVSRLRASCEDGLLLVLQGQPSQPLSDVRADICRAHQHVKRYFPAAARLRFVSLQLVPEGVFYERQWLSAGLAPGLSLALRYYEDTAFGRRQMVRAFSHEAFHTRSSPTPPCPVLRERNRVPRSSRAASNSAFSDLPSAMWWMRPGASRRLIK